MRGALAVLLLLLFLGTVPCSSGRSVRAFFNGREATVSNISLSPGEPFTVDLYITPDGDATTYAELDEPGAPRAYDRVGGDELMPTAGKYCNASHAARYHWAMVVSDRWTDGTAPLNIYYQINRPGSDFMIASGYFTVVEAYIAPGKAMVAGGGEARGEAMPTPGPEALSVLIALAVVLFFLELKRDTLSKSI